MKAKLWQQILLCPFDPVDLVAAAKLGCTPRLRSLIRGCLLSSRTRPDGASPNCGAPVPQNVSPLEEAMGPESFSRSNPPAPYHVPGAARHRATLEGCRK